MESKASPLGSQIGARCGLYGSGGFRLSACDWILDDTRRGRAYRSRYSAVATAPQTLAAREESTKRLIATRKAKLLCLAGVLLHIIILRTSSAASKHAEVAARRGLREAKVTLMKLNVKAFAITCALIWGLGLFALTWWVIAFDGATGEVTLIGRLYRGYTISPAGSVIGLIWAVVDGFVGGAVFAWVYNRFAR